MTTTAAQDTVPAGTLEDGRVVSIAGPVIDVEFPPHALPEINHAVEFTIELDGTSSQVTAEVAQQIGDGRVRCICMQQTDGLVRGTRGAQPGPGHHGAGGERRARPRLQRAGPAAGHRRRRGRGRLLGDPPQRAGLRPARAAGPDVRDRDQGGRPPRAVRAGWEDRPLRRGRRGQDRHHPGDDPPRGPAARWCLGLRRRGGAHP